MTDRSRTANDLRQTRRSPGRSETARLWRPTVEALERRALLSVAGGPDSTYPSAVQFAPVTFPSIVTAEAVQPDNKTVVVGYLANDFATGASPIVDVGYVARLNVNGTLDPLFGKNGSVALPAPEGENQADVVAIQADGKIVVAANITINADQLADYVAIYRLDADGSFDTTFGGGGVTVLFGGTYVGTPTALAIQPDGKILVGEDASNYVDIARLDANGAVDSSFGTAGQALVDFTSGGAYLFNQDGVAGMALQADGSIDYDTTVVPNSGLGSEIAVGRLTAAGVPDLTFGTGGSVVLPGTSMGNTDTAGALALQPGGKLIVAGAYDTDLGFASSPETHFDVYRLNTNGSVDTTFGTMGEATPGFVRSSVTPEEDVVNSILIESDGQIFVGGTIKLGPPGADLTQTPTLISLNPNGSPDAQFGTGGQVVFAQGQKANAFNENGEIFNSIYGLAIQSDGKILAQTYAGVMRLLSSGSSNDYDEDGTTDPAVLLPNFAAPVFAYRPSTGAADSLAPFGIAGAGLTLPAPGAYDGGGVDELGVYLPSIGAFAVRAQYTDYPEDRITFIGQKGVGNSIPAEADYTGSGFTEIGVYEPATASFVYQPNSYPLNDALSVTIPFGTKGAGNSIPVPADYDGAGHDEIAVYLPALGAFAYRPANGGADVIIPFGSAGAGNSIPIPGDYDNSGHTELAVYLPALGAFAYRPYNGGADVIVPFGTPGLGNSIPAPGDYDGSGHTELAVYLPALGAFAYRPFDGGADVFVPFGQPGTGASIPFNAAGAATIEGGSGGNGPRGNAPGYLDFVPEIAGAAKKKDAGLATTSPGSGQS